MSDMQKERHLSALLTALNNEFESNKLFYAVKSNPDVEFERKYTAAKEEHVIAKLATGELGTVQDCYLLYAIAMLGISDSFAICQFLKVLQRRHKDLPIGSLWEKSTDKSVDNMHIFERFIARLARAGYIMRTEYYSGTSKQVLYSATSSAVQLCSQVLSKRIVYADKCYLPMRPATELLGWALASRIASESMESSCYVACHDGVNKFPHVGTIMYPIELEFKVDGVNHFVSYRYAYFNHDKSRQSTRDFYEHCIRVVNEVVFYLNYRTKRNSFAIASLVCVVEDYHDLEMIAGMIVDASESQDITDTIQNLYFTGESIYRRNFGLENSFLSIKLDASEEKGYQIVPAYPPFIQV